MSALDWLGYRRKRSMSALQIDLGLLKLASKYHHRCELKWYLRFVVSSDSSDSSDPSKVRVGDYCLVNNKSYVFRIP